MLALKIKQSAGLVVWNQSPFQTKLRGNLFFKGWLRLIRYNGIIRHAAFFKKIKEELNDKVRKNKSYQTVLKDKLFGRILL